MLHFSRRQSLLVGLSLAILTSCIGRGCYYQGMRQASAQEATSVFSQDPISEDPVDTPREVVVHLCGEVRRPGVYRMREGARVAEAVKLAGGETSRGDRHALNLAQLVKDGERIWVPSREETRLQRQADLARLRALVQPAGPPPKAAQATVAPSHAAILRVNVNQADSEAWEALPGIGPVTAQAILEYRRTHGRFTRLEELMDVPGIGEKTFERIQPYLALE